MKHNLVPELTNGEFEAFIKSGTALVDFFADWCMPCVMMGPVVDELAEKFKGKIKFGKVNIEDNQVLASKFNVKSIPNLILFKERKVVETFIGSRSAEDFEEELKKFV